MKRVRMFGDHSAYHSGCAAVWGVLRQAVVDAGMTPVGDNDDYDVLVVNGEGSMHRGRPTFLKKMERLKNAITTEREAWLVNSVWEANPPAYDNVLAKLTGLVVREVLSQRELSEAHKTDASVRLDLSYHAHIEATAPTLGPEGHIYFTDYLNRDSGQFEPLPPRAVPPEGRLFELNKITWSSAVLSLQKAGLLVTGRHHAVYAACRARTPFAAVEGNTHKIRGLLETAGSKIPVASTAAQLPELTDWVRTHQADYDRLFDWMEEQASRTPPAAMFQR